MKTIQLLIATLLLASLSLQATAQESQPLPQTELTADGVAVYYFHYTRRCATCNAVEQVTRETLKELYGNKVLFADYNLDESQGEAIGNTLDVSGQSLLVVAQGVRADLTGEGFMYARTQPEKLKQLIKEKIDPLLPQ